MATALDQPGQFVNRPGN